MGNSSEPRPPLDLSSGALDLSKQDPEAKVEQEIQLALSTAAQRELDLDGDRRWILKALFIFISILVVLSVVPELFVSPDDAAARAFDIFKVAFPSLTLAIGYYFAKAG